MKNNEFEELKKGSKFTWGDIVKFHEISNIGIVECHPYKYDGCVGTDDIDYETKQFHVFIDGRSSCHSYSSLDTALIGAMAYKYDGCNSQADKFFIRMVKMDQAT